MKAITLEFYKLRHKHIFLMITLFIIIEIAWAFVATGMSVKGNSDQGEWELIISILSSMNGLFLPILSAVCVSRICDMEHKGNTWKLLLSLSIKRGQLYTAKYLCANSVMLYVCIVQVITAIIFGAVSRFEQQIPILLFLRFLSGTVLANMVIISLQQWVSMAVKNQAFSLCLGMIGGFLGLVADLLPAGIKRFFIWSYYTALSPITQSYSNEKVHLIIRKWNTTIPMITGLIITGIGIYLAGCWFVSRQEV